MPWKRTVSLLIGACVGSVALVLSNREVVSPATLVFALLSVTFWFGALVSAGLSLLDVLSRRSQSREREHHRTDSDYVAAYSATDRIIATGVWVFLSVLSAFVMPTHALFGSIVGLAGVLSSFYVCHVWYTRITLSARAIVVKKAFAQDMVQGYTNVSKILYGASSVKVVFSDRRSFTLDSALGDPDQILFLLRTRCRSGLVPRPTRFRQWQDRKSSGH